MIRSIRTPGSLTTVGLHADATHVYAALAVHTAAGAQVVRTLAQALGGRSAATACREAFEELARAGGQPGAVTVAIPDRDVHYESRNLSPAPDDRWLHSPDVLATVLPPGRDAAATALALARHPSRVGRPFAVAAWRREALAEHAPWPGPPPVPVRFEPVALALLRLALSVQPASAGPGLELRLVAGREQVVGYLMDRNDPVIWKTAARAEDQAAPDPGPLVAELVGLARETLHQPLAVVAHGPVDAARLSAATGERVELVQAPSYDGPSVALGLALSRGETGARGLAFELEAPHRAPGDRMAFDLAAAVVLAGGLAASMQAAGDRLAVEVERERAAAIGRADVLALPLPELLQRRGALAAEAGLLAGYLDRPASWAGVLAALSRATPDAVKITDLQLLPPPLDPATGKRVPEYSLRLGTADRELLLEGLLSDRTLRRLFQHVEPLRPDTDPDATPNELCVSGTVSPDDEGEPPGGRR